MKYLISDDELIKFINKITKLQHDWFVGLDDKAIAEDFLKSKQPVELVGEIKPRFMFENIAIDCSKYQGRQVKIFSQEVFE